MDARTEVHREVKDESSEEDMQLSPSAPSIDDDGDSDKSGGNSKKRKRGSYRCSRCGMPKRGHNCPDTFEGVHFAIVDSPTPSTSAMSQNGVANAASNPKPGYGNVVAAFDDCPRETLLMHLASLQDDNMRLVNENARLYEMCQFQAHALHSMHPDYARNGMSGPMRSNGASPAPGVYPTAPQALPLFAQTPSGNPVTSNGALPLPPAVRPNFIAGHGPTTPQHLMSQQSSAATAVKSGSVSNFARNGTSGSEDRAPIAKRSKMEETGQSAYATHQYAPIHAPFPPEHVAEMRAHLTAYPRSIPIAADQSTHPFDFDYERHDWFDNDSSTSEYYPSDASPPLIY